MRTPVAEPFTIAVPDEVLTDLHERLARTRLLPDSPGRPPSGMSAGYLADLVRSWQDFDWRARERWLNEHPQFLVDLGDVTLHFVHLRASAEDAPALLVMHGWPHTFALQLDFADLLPDFHVDVASLPGFAFSSPYRAGLMGNQRLADTMNRLMVDVLGYTRYLTYGEDVTADVNDMLAATHPESVQGVIVTHAHFPTKEERAELDHPLATAFFDRLAADQYAMGGYAHEQGTRPDTLAVGLNDSPAGLLAWIAEKLVEWSDTPEGDPPSVERRISRDRILTEATIYWITQTVASSFRPYFEPRQEAAVPPVTVPASVHIQRHEHDNPESVARAFYRDLRAFERLDEGGHFAVAEVPEVMAVRTRAFARELRILPAP